MISSLADGVRVAGKLIGVRKNSKDIEFGEYEEFPIYHIRTREFGDTIVIDERANNRILVNLSTVFHKGYGFYSPDILIECSGKFGRSTNGHDCVMFEKDPYEHPKRILSSIKDVDFDIYERSSAEYMVYSTILDAIRIDLSRRFLLHQ